MSNLVSILLQFLLFMSILIAVILNTAVLRDKYIENTQLLQSTVRRLQLVGFLLLLLRYSWLLYTVGEIEVYALAALAITIIAISSSLQCGLMIQARWNNHYDGNERRTGNERRASPEKMPKEPRRKGERRSDCTPSTYEPEEE